MYYLLSVKKEDSEANHQAVEPSQFPHLKPKDSEANHQALEIMEITVKESSIVRPAAETPSHNLWCSSVDQRMMKCKHVDVAIFYKPNGSPDFFQPEMLKEALSNALVPFYPVAGRLGRDESGRIQIVCNAEGVLFVQAESTAILDDLDHFTSDPNIFPLVDYSGDISSYPLYLIQVTRFQCGGISIGFKSHHVLADGSSIMHFASSWCDMARGNKSIRISPFLDRTIMKALMPPASTYHHIEFDPSPTMSMPLSSSSTSTPVLFKITENQLNQLRDKLTKNYSTYCVLAAHFWRCVTKARGLPRDQATRLTIPSDRRSAFNCPQLPQGYFGNASFDASALALAGDLLSEPFEITVERIQVAINRLDVAYLKSSIARLENLVTGPASAAIHEQNPHRCPNLCVNNLSRFPAQEMDFGWGAPIFMAKLPDVAEISMVPPKSTDDNDGGLTLIAGLETSHVKLYEDLICENPASKL